MAKLSRNERRKMRHQRLRQKVAGMPNKPRLNVFRSLSHIYAQVIDDLKGETLVAASSLEEDVKSKGGDLTKTEQARLVGELVAERASEAGVKQVVFDRGGYKYHGRIKALAEGAREGGLEF